MPAHPSRGRGYIKLPREVIAALSRLRPQDAWLLVQLLGLADHRTGRIEQRGTLREIGLELGVGRYETFRERLANLEAAAYVAVQVPSNQHVQAIIEVPRYRELTGSAVPETATAGSAALAESAEAPDVAEAVALAPALAVGLAKTAEADGARPAALASEELKTGTGTDSKAALDPDRRELGAALENGSLPDKFSGWQIDLLRKIVAENDAFARLTVGHLDRLRHQLGGEELTSCLIELRQTVPLDDVRHPDAYLDSIVDRRRKEVHHR
jgi:hypothetical protein